MNSVLANIGWLGQIQVQGSWFSDLASSHRFVIALVVIICLTVAVIAVAGIVTAMMTTIHRERTEAELKREMLDRGLSADEIAQVIESRTPDNFLDRWASGRRNQKPKRPEQREAAT